MKLLLLSALIPALLWANPDKVYRYVVFKRWDGGYGYTIYKDGKKLIRQESIPGLEGNRGFARKADAVNVAELVIHKLEQNIFPPTVSSAELERLHIW